MFKRSLALLLVLMLTMGMFVGCGGGNEEAEAAPASDEASDAVQSEEPADMGKVGFIYVGPIGDGGWTYAHDQARLYLEDQMGVATLYKESVPEDAEVEKTIMDMIDQGATVIFATSFGYMDYVEKISKEFPDVTFMHCSGYKSTDNMGNYFGRMYEPRFLSGVVAGMKTESNKLGYVAAFEIPEVVRGINAFALGAQSVNPDVEVEVVWTHTWYDPATEKEAGKALLDNGCDVIAQHQDTAGPQQAAEERGKFAIGYNTDSREMAPNAYMTAPIWNWGPYYVDQVTKAFDGTWSNEPYWGGMSDGVVDLDSLTELAPEGAQAKVNELKAQIVDGSLMVFQGPLYDQNGELKVEEGTTMTDGDLLSMDWFVQGVKGKLQ